LPQHLSIYLSCCRKEEEEEEAATATEEAEEEVGGPSLSMFDKSSCTRLHFLTPQSFQLPCDLSGRIRRF
jgi:hypothetical protein